MSFFLKKFKYVVFASISFLGVGVVSIHAEDKIMQAQPELPTEELTITSANGHTNRFTVEVAKTEHQQEVGEMFRKTIQPDHGMLFIWAAPTQSDMWMRNTYVALDMIFIDSHHHIHAIEENTIPLSEAIISSHGVVGSVLEVPAGTAARLGLLVGDDVESASLR